MMTRLVKSFGCMFALMAVLYIVPMTVQAASDCAALTGYVVPRSECDALVNFYNSTVGSGWSNSSGWITNTNACSWRGVSCTSVTGHSYVDDITLDSNNLSGTLPTSFALPHLTFIELDSNEIGGTLPSSRSGLTSIISIRIPYNNLTGTLPDSRSVLPNFTMLFVEGNDLNGSLPTSRSNIRGMRDFVIGNNKFTGPLPEEYAAWTGLSRFSATYNLFSGTLPDSRSGWQAITTVSLYGNPNIHGTLPRGWSVWAPTIQNFSVGTSLNGVGGGVEGTLPTEWSVWTHMTSFDIDGSSITGTLPSSWSTWTGMIDFRIFNTDVQGEIPASWTSWVNPQVIYLRGTHLYGNLGRFMAWTGITNMDISDSCFRITGLSTGLVAWMNTYNNGGDRTSQKSCVQVSMDKTVNTSSARVGDTLTYTLNYTIHTGTNITTFRIYDLRNTGLTLSTSSVSLAGSGTYEGSNSWYRDVPLATGGTTGNITINALIGSLTSGAVITNTGIVDNEDLVQLEGVVYADNVATTITSTAAPIYGGGGSSSSSSSSRISGTSGTTGGSSSTPSTPDASSSSPSSEDTSSQVSPSDQNPRNCSDMEFNTAYSYASALNITTMKSCLGAMMNGMLLRKHAAKMLTEFAIHVFNKVPDESRACEFSDMASEDKEMRTYAKAACQLGLMGLNGQGDAKATFSPNEYVTIAQAGTIISRLLWGDKHNTSSDTQNTCRYCSHLAALKEAGIMKVIDHPEEFILRGWLMIVMERVSHLGL